MTVDTYLAYLAVVAIFFATPPGPSQVLMISNSLRHGVRRSTATMAGDLTANALQMMAAGFGLAVVISQSATAVAFIKWAGVAYLIYVGVKTFRSVPAPLDREEPRGALGRRLYLQGFVTSASNPKAVLFFAALFPQFIDPASPIWPQLLILGGTYLLVDGVLLVLWGAGAERALQRLRRNARLLNRVSGGMMIAAAGLLATRSMDVR
ncbi:MAG: LysE family translocator [Pseudomonadota bacterium]